MKFDIKDVLKFDIKDVKSWANRHDVEVGAEGYFFNKISDLHSIERIGYSKIESINDNQANCFISTAFYGGYSFFLPLNAVKKYKYRPFKTIDELECMINKDNRSAHQFMSVGNDIFIRDKDKISHLMITRIDVDAKTNEVINVNGMSPIYLFNNCEIRVGAKWVPFRVEVIGE